MQSIRIEKPDKRHKSPILINAYNNPTTCIAGASWDFLEEMADKLGGTIMMCGDFNARSSLWAQHGTYQQGCALEAALLDVLFTPVSTASPTHPGTRQGDTDSTIGQALVSPKLVPWTCAETLASHRSDHLCVCVCVCVCVTRYHERYTKSRAANGATCLKMLCDPILSISSLSTFQSLWPLTHLLGAGFH